MAFPPGEPQELLELRPQHIAGVAVTLGQAHPFPMSDADRGRAGRSYGTQDGGGLVRVDTLDLILHD